jgi:hypothetical protein
MFKTGRKFAAIVAVSAVAVPVLGASAAQAATASQRNALESAQSYLSTEAFSRSGLIDQLHSPYGEGYPKSVAVWAVNHVRANWNAQAVKSARSYLSSSSFSRSGLVQQLHSPYGDGFTLAQAEYGVSRAYH